MRLGRLFRHQLLLVVLISACGSGEGDNDVVPSAVTDVGQDEAEATEWCGNGHCALDHDENCSACPEDCGCTSPAVCRDAACCTPATCKEQGVECGFIDDGCGITIPCGTCPDHYRCAMAKCVAESWCGDGTCDLNETCASCEADCACAAPAVCNDAVCCTPTTCDAQSVACGDLDDGCGGIVPCGACPEHQQCEAGTCVVQPWCGDGTCDDLLNEDCATCPGDCGCACGQACGDGLCTFTACEGKVCGDDGCGGSCGTCPDHYQCSAGACIYQPWCGDDTCDPDETCASCAADCVCTCGHSCVDGACAFTACDGKVCGDDGCGESCGDCPAHSQCDGGACIYQSWCGDGACDPDETCASCVVDCGCSCGLSCADVGPEGGSTEILDPTGRIVILEVPAGAVDAPIVVEAAYVQDLEGTVLAAESAGTPEPTSTVAVVAMGPSGTTFAEPIAIEVDLVEALPAGSLAPVFLYDAASDSWAMARTLDGGPVIGIVGADGLHLTFLTDHFSTYGIGSVANVFSEPLIDPGVPLLVPTMLFTESAFAGPGTELVLLSETARGLAYKHVLMELALRTQRPRTDAENDFGARFLDNLKSAIDNEGSGYKKTLKTFKHIKLLCDDALASEGPQIMGYAAEVKNLQAASAKVAEAATWLSTALTVMTCVDEGLAKFLTYGAVDYGRAATRLAAARTYMENSDLYAQDPAFRWALDEAKGAIDLLQDDVGARIMQSLEDIALADCGLAVLGTWLSAVANTALLKTIGTLGGGLVAAVIFDYAVKDIVLNDVGKSTLQGISMSALATIAVYTNIYQAIEDVKGLDVQPELWGDPEMQKKILAAQVANYALLSTKKLAADVLRQADAGVLNKGLMTATQWVGSLFGAATREDLAKVFDAQVAVCENLDTLLASAYPRLCTPENAGLLACGACVPSCGTAVCGDDGCGGSCGTCSVGTCNEATGQCEATCTPDCAGKQCGPDGCQSTCGTCSGGESCNGNGQCIVVNNDITWIALPAGTYQMGSTAGYSNEQPVHSVTLSAFEMAKSEVTVAQYAACVSAGGCTAAHTWSSYCNWGIAGKEQHPINCVTWYQSSDFCTWAGARLCTEAEWEYAARSGGQNQTYPWGDATATCDYAVIYDGNSGNGCGTNSTWAVCGKAAGNSTQGVCDLAGNVWEWVADRYDTYPSGAQTNPTGPASGSYPVDRGGGFYELGGDYLRASVRGYDDPVDYNYVLGARCCRSLPPSCPADKDCTNRVCGPDPVCGESCGSCGAGSSCTAGQCVAATFLDNGDGTVTDTKTNLVWQKTSNASSFMMCADPNFLDYYDYTLCPSQYGDASNHCTDNIDGLPGTGWRLPTISELRSIIQGCAATQSVGTCNVSELGGGCLAWGCRDGSCDGCSYPGGPGEEGRYIDPVFLNNGNSWFWSSSLGADNPYAAWGVYFGDGLVGNGFVNDGNVGVRCVRSGP